MDFCSKSSGLADFENTVDRGSAVTFDADSGLCRSSVWILGPKRNLDHRSFFSLSRNVNEFIQIISFFERSSFKLKGETVFGIVHCYWAKLTVVFTCTRLPLKLNSSVFGCGCSFGFEQNFWRIEGFGQKKARIGGFASTPIPPPHLGAVSAYRKCPGAEVFTYRGC